MSSFTENGVNVYLLTATNNQTDRQRDRETDRQRDKSTVAVAEEQ